MLPLSLLLIDRKGVPASVLMAMAALESNNGKSQLSSKYNNYFGIKAKTGQNAAILPTKEIIKGKEVTINQAFAAYSSPSQSAKAFVSLLNSPIYKEALKAKGTQNIIREIVKSGYATANPDIYASLAMQAYSRYNSNKYKVFAAVALPIAVITAIIVSQNKGN